MRLSLVLSEALLGNSTFYKWRDKYGGLEMSDIKLLKEIEAENLMLIH